MRFWQNEAIIESALAAPFQSFGGHPAFATVQQFGFRFNFKSPIYRWEQANRRTRYVGCISYEWD